MRKLVKSDKVWALRNTMIPSLISYFWQICHGYLTLVEDGLRVYGNSILSLQFF